MSQDKGHSPVGASTRYRWSNCPGSVKLCKGLPPSPPTPYALEGTKAHEMAAAFLTTSKWPKEAPPEMIEHLDSYITDVLQTYRTLRNKKQDKFLIEHGFELTMLHSDAWGTADAVIWDSTTKTIYVYDLKYGAGIFVEAENNEQLIYYAVGAFLSLDLPAEKVVLKIAQPRFESAEKIRSHEFLADKLIEEAYKIETEIKRTDDPKAPIIPGDHCRFCPAIGICPELSKKSQLIAKNLFAPAMAYEPEKLSETLEKLPMLEAFINGVREFAYSEAMQGRIPPNYKLVEKRATRKWKDEEGIAVHWKQVFGDKAFETKLKSPAQIEKMMPGGAGKKSVDKECVLISSGLKLVHTTEKGEPVLLDAKNIFKNEDDCESFFETEKP